MRRYFEPSSVLNFAWLDAIENAYSTQYRERFIIHEIVNVNEEVSLMSVVQFLFSDRIGTNVLDVPCRYKARFQYFKITYIKMSFISKHYVQ